MERVKGDQFMGVETVDVLPSEASYYGSTLGGDAPVQV
jgi:hypothetical protein